RPRCAIYLTACARGRTRSFSLLSARQPVTTDLASRTHVPPLLAGCAVRTRRPHPRPAPGPLGRPLFDTVRQSVRVAAADGRYRVYPEYIVPAATRPVRRVPTPSPDCPRPSPLRSSSICREAATPGRQTPDRTCRSP